MKKTLLAATLVLGAAFLVITWTRLSPGGSAPTGEDRTLDRARIQSFWDAYRAATEARVAGDFPGAAGLYRRALELDPDHEESLYYLGNSLFELGLFEDAATLYRRLAELEPQSQRAFSQLGAVHSTLRPGARPAWEVARESYLQCVRINPEESGPFLRLGTLSLEQDRLEEAARHFDTAAGFRSPEGLFQAGLVRTFQGRWEEASREFVRVLEVAEQEARISGRGVLSEGDVRSGTAARLTPLEEAAVKARFHLFWASQRRGGYPPQVPESFRLDPGRFPAGPTRSAGKFADSGGAAAWADFDGDGDPDLAFSGGDGAVFTLLQNQRGRLRRIATGLPGGLSGSDLAWGDPDGDGDPDLLLLRFDWATPQPPLLLVNQGGWAEGRGSFEPGPGFPGLPKEHRFVRGLFRDLDGDGRDELLLASFDTPGLRLLRARAGSWEEEPDGLPRIEGPATDLAAGDLNGDGRGDLLVWRWKHPPVVLLGQGGRFESAAGRVGLSGLAPEGLRVVLLDYDRDGDADLLASGYASYGEALEALLPSAAARRTGPRLFANQPQGFAEVTAEAGLDRATSTMALAAADLNGDGWTDLVFAEGGFERERLLPSSIWLNRSGTFQLHALLPGIDRPLNARGVAAADWDGDGWAEVFLPGAGRFALPR